jgi:hypothetical protein
MQPIRLVEESDRPMGPRALAPLPDQAVPAPTSPTTKVEEKRGILGRVSRIGLGLAAVAVAGYFIYDRFFALGSTNAVLSATPLVLRAPIEGQLTLNSIASGTLLEERTPIGKLNNTRLDNSRVHDISAQVIAAEQEVDLIRQRIINAEQEAIDALAQASSFQKAKVDQIDARLDESEARIRNAQARLREAEGIQGRNEQLLRSGVATLAAVEQARRGLEVARGDLEVAIRQRQGIRTELDAAGQGIFTGETGTNRSASQQQYDRARQQQRELSAAFNDRQARLDALRSQLITERTEIARRAAADLEVLVRSRLIRFSAQSGEFVRQGQDIATLIDCTRPLVTVEVSDRIFRSLNMGMQGNFTPVGGGQQVQGTIVELQTPLTNQPGQSGQYRAIMQVSDPALVQACDTGRAGRVSF